GRAKNQNLPPGLCQVVPLLPVITGQMIQLIVEAILGAVDVTEQTLEGPGVLTLGHLEGHICVEITNFIVGYRTSASGPGRAWHTGSRAPPGSYSSGRTSPGVRLHSRASHS